MELAQHKRLTGDTTVQVYFCDPQSPCSGARINVRTACCVSISRMAQTCHAIPKQT